MQEQLHFFIFPIWNTEFPYTLSASSTCLAWECHSLEIPSLLSEATILSWAKSCNLLYSALLHTFLLKTPCSFVASCIRLNISHVISIHWGHSTVSGQSISNLIDTISSLTGTIDINETAIIHSNPCWKHGCIDIYVTDLEVWQSTAKTHHLFIFHLNVSNHTTSAFLWAFNGRRMKDNGCTLRSVLDRNFSCEASETKEQAAQRAGVVSPSSRALKTSWDKALTSEVMLLWAGPWTRDPELPPSPHNPPRTFLHRYQTFRGSADKNE